MIGTIIHGSSIELLETQLTKKKTLLAAVYQGNKSLSEKTKLVSAEIKKINVSWEKLFSTIGFGVGSAGGIAAIVAAVSSPFSIAVPAGITATLTTSTIM